MSEINMMQGMWPERVTPGEVVYPPGSTLGPRIQSSIELVLIHVGEMTVWLDGQRHYAPAGTVTLLFPGPEERFVFARHGDTHHTFIHVWLPSLPPDLERRLRLLPWLLPLSALMHNLMLSALQLYQSSLTTADMLLKTVALQMLFHYLGEGERLLSGEGSLHTAVERAQQYIQLHLSEPLTLDDIAEESAVSPAHLIRLFNTALGVTPIAYLWEQRVRHGVELLESTGLSVGLIAEQCGFQTSDHFSRRVRQATGQPPLVVRRRAWGKDS